MNLLTYQPMPEPEREPERWTTLTAYNPLRRYVERQIDPYFDCLSHYLDHKVMYDSAEVLRQLDSGGLDGH